MSINAWYREFSMASETIQFNTLFLETVSHFPLSLDMRRDSGKCQVEFVDIRICGVRKARRRHLREGTMELRKEGAK